MLPLNTGWRIFADDLPARLTESEPDTAFHLPGADALADFSDLLGENACPDSSEAAPTDAPFPLPAALPEDVRGAAELRLELDFGKLHAQDAELVFELIRGKGRVFIGDTPAASFQNPKDGMLRVPLFRALHLGRRQTVRLCFDASRPAGVLGGVCLHAVSHARLRDTVLIPDAQTQTVRLQTTVCAMNTGDYLLRVQTACAENEPPVYDDALFLSSGEQQSITKTFPFPAPRFLPGSPYAGCAVRLTLFKRRLHRGTFFPGSRCDEQTVSCGYSGRPADYDLPLLPEECTDPDALLTRLSPMRLPGLRLDTPAPDLFYRKMTLSGIGVFHPVVTDALRERLSRHACVSFGNAPMPRMRSLPLLDAWQLCGLTACLRTPPANLSPAELLLEAAGKPLDPQSPDVAAVLLWLRAVRVRLSAEAARQGRFSGSLCAPGVWQDEDVYAALQTALAPTHISALPLRGAWFAGSRFSASIRAFVEPEKSADDLIVRAYLEDENGKKLATLKRPCPPDGGEIGLLECTLPHSVCVLTLFASLSRGNQVMEQNQIPVYVGEKGMLEAAF